MASRADWIERLGAGEVAEIESAVRRLEESRIELTKITPEHVPLPTLARRLHTILDEVLNGRGCITTD
jgi:hypothetical protein